MASSILCRCCLLRPPDKNLKSQYTILGNTEVYADMLKDCFEIHFPVGDKKTGNGICEVCIMRLRDACSFKQQVQSCQVELANLLVKDEALTEVKEEISDTDDNNIYFIELKEEMSDFEDDKTLSETGFYKFNDITIKKRHRDKHRSVKTRPLHGQKTATEIKKKKSIHPMKFSLKKIILADPSMHITSPLIKHRENLTNLLKHSNCTPFHQKTLNGIVCIHCPDTLPTFEALRSHMNEQHPNTWIVKQKKMEGNNLSIKMDITDLKCNICGLPSDVISTLKKHLINEHDIKFHMDIKDYYVEFKLNESEVLNCALCHSTFETFKMLLQHMNGHYRNHICEVCDAGFINKHRLRSHKRIHDLGNFNCTYCDKEFTTRVKKLCHEKYTHKDGARYTTNCPHCDETFTSYYQRNRHMTTAHNSAAATYKCNICEKTYFMKAKLTSHIKKVHLLERNHICSECGEGFFRKQSLDDHMVRHTGERVHKCNVCQKAYARKKTLREHMRIHNNDRRFKCGVCALAFVQKCSLKSHMLSNHGLSLVEYESASNSSSHQN